MNCHLSEAEAGAIARLLADEGFVTAHFSVPPMSDSSAALLAKPCPAFFAAAQNFLVRAVAVEGPSSALLPVALVFGAMLNGVVLGYRIARFERDRAELAAMTREGL
jgi:hypothetical protein